MAKGERRAVEDDQSGSEAEFVAACLRLPRSVTGIRDLDAVESVAWVEAPQARIEALAVLKQISLDRALVERELDLAESELVVRLYRLGASWAQIASVMNIQAAGLYKRYRHAVGEDRPAAIALNSRRTASTSHGSGRPGSKPRAKK